MCSVENAIGIVSVGRLDRLHLQLASQHSQTVSARGYLLETESLGSLPVQSTFENVCGCLATQQDCSVGYFVGCGW